MNVVSFGKTETIATENEMETSIDASPDTAGASAAASGEDILACLARIEPGYVEITRPDGTTEHLFVLDFEMAPGFVVSVGFRQDRPETGGDLGQPIFLHKRMQIRHLGSVGQYLEDSLVRQVLAGLEFRYPIERGLLPLLRIVELIRSGRALASDASNLLRTTLG